MEMLIGLRNESRYSVMHVINSVYRSSSLEASNMKKEDEELKSESIEFK